MKTKLFALILACLMVLPMLVSCGGGSEKEETKATTETKPVSSETVENEFAEIDRYVEGLAAEYNFEGATFSMIDNGEQIPDEYEITGILEDDALYSRYRELEETFGITMELIERTAEGTDFDYAGEAIADDVKRDVMAGGSSYDLICGGLVSCGQNLVNNGVIRSAADLPGLDFTKTWWVPDLDEKFSIGGNMYFCAGKITASHYLNPAMMVYSKQIAEDFNITEDLYAVVEDGKWTVDKMFEVASAVPANTSGSGIYKYVWTDGLDFYEAGGFYITGRDEAGNPSIAGSLTSEQIDYIDKLSAVFSDQTQNFDVTTYAKENGYDQPDNEHNIFAEERFLFTTTSLGGIKDLRDEDMDFGILPMPKRNEEQENYYAYSDSWLLYAVYFSQNLKDEEMSGVITEAMAALSEKYMEPAYYEKALKGRSTTDVESRRMLDIIYNNVVVDLAAAYRWGNLTDLVSEAVMGTKDNVTSSYASASKAANRVITTLVRKIERQNASK